MAVTKVGGRWVFDTVVIVRLDEAGVLFAEIETMGDRGTQNLGQLKEREVILLQ